MILRDYRGDLHELGAGSCVTLDEDSAGSHLLLSHAGAVEAAVILRAPHSVCLAVRRAIWSAWSAGRKSHDLQTGEAVATVTPLRVVKPSATARKPRKGTS